MISHRSTAFREIYRRVQDGLRRVFLTERPVLIVTSSATGLMEAAIRNAPPGSVLALVNGGFSERFAQIATACGRTVERYEIPWGQVHDPTEVEQRARAGQHRTVTVVHSETSTGALNDVRAISDAAHRAGALCCIDSVSGIRGTPLRFDDWHLDFVLTGSQKALALPPGLAFAVASEAFLAGGAPAGRGVYFDLAEIAAAAARDEAPNTPVLSVYYALEAQLGWVMAEGLEAAWTRHASMAALTVQWVETLRAQVDPEIAVVAVEGHRSPTVTAIRLPPRFSPEAVLRGVSARGFTVGSGYGKLKATTIRVGHMGDHTPGGVARCLETVGAVLRGV